MDDKRTFVRAMFARIAPRYDLVNFLMTFGQDRRWRRRAAALALAPSPTVPLALDLATGTGDLLYALAQVNPHTRGIGLDLTREMLNRAAEKTRRAAWVTAPSLVNGDTLELPFPRDTFDAITSAFMLRNLTDLERAFSEMARVARPQARVVALEITRPRLPLWRALFQFYFYRLVPLLGGLVSGDFGAYRYLPESLSAFTSAEELAAIMTRAGLRQVRYVLLNLGTIAIHYGTK
jgi:demethylmenaquinone methyltransferase/2-methoxy-6-polyprenyl-1,4-benzoquinol methylase